MVDLISGHIGLILVLILTSAFAGFAAGLFGIGGGAIIVPALYFVFVSLGYPETAMHTALATSLATIVLTSLRSVQSHHKKKSVDWDVLRHWGPWIMVGAILGQITASLLSGSALALIFALLAYLLSAQLLFGKPGWRLSDTLPTGASRAGLGGGIGFFSTLMGIGGGVFGVTLMTVFGRPMTQAVGTAAGFGAAIGLPSAVAAMVTGHGVEGLPPFSLGYVNLLAFAFVSTLTVAITPLGARAAYALDARRLKQLFAVLLFLVATRILWAAISAGLT